MKLPLILAGILSLLSHNVRDAHSQLLAVRGSNSDYRFANVEEVVIYFELNGTPTEKALGVPRSTMEADVLAALSEIVIDQIKIPVYVPAVPLTPRPKLANQSLIEYVRTKLENTENGCVSIIAIDLEREDSSERPIYLRRNLHFNQTKSKCQYSNVLWFVQHTLDQQVVSGLIAQRRRHPEPIERRFFPTK